MAFNRKQYDENKRKETEQLKETVLELSTELKRYSSFMNLSDQQLADLVQNIQPDFNVELRKKSDEQFGE